MGYRVLYFNATKLFAKLKMAKADGSYLKWMSKLERQHLLIIDDFRLQALIVTSQLPVDKWYDVIGEKTIADAILDRLIHQANRIELNGESMRRKQSKTQ